MSDTYRVLVTGSRDWDDPVPIRSVLMDLHLDHDSIVVVHGACPSGADMHAAHAARDLWMAEEPHPADWSRYGKRAGFLRNEEMVALGAAVGLAFIMPCTKPGCRNGKPHGSHGASHCAAQAARAGIPVRRFASLGKGMWHEL